MPSGNIWTYEDDLSGFSGAIGLSGTGSLRFNQGPFAWGSPQCAFDLGSSATLNNRATSSAVTVYLGALSGGSGSTLQASQQSVGTDLTDTYVVGDLNLDTTFSGSIVDGPNHALELSKVGSGSLTLSGNSTYSGGTVISSGALVVDNATGTGSGPVVVEAGATLGGSGTVAGDTTVDDGGILAPGSTVGTITFVGDLSLNEFSRLRFELGTVSNEVVVEGSLFAAGLIEITDAGGFGPGVYTLFRWNTNQSVVPGVLVIDTAPGGYNYNLRTNGPGRIDLVVTTQAPAFGQIGTSGSELIMSGSGGTPSGDYHVLTATNLSLPLVQWLPVSTNQFDNSGNFSITNPIEPGIPEQFYRLEEP